MKVFSTKFGGMASFGGTSEQSAKVCSANIYFPPICERFILQKFPVIVLNHFWEAMGRVCVQCSFMQNIAPL